MVMIIQCPNCGFSGRIPGYAVAIPHHARCLKCRHQFELGTLLQGEPGREPPGPSTEDTSARSRTGQEQDPGSSFYELKAITEDDGSALEQEDIVDPWGDGEDD